MGVLLHSVCGPSWFCTIHALRAAWLALVECVTDPVAAPPYLGCPALPYPFLTQARWSKAASQILGMVGLLYTLVRARMAAQGRAQRHWHPSVAADSRIAMAALSGDASGPGV